MTVSAKQRKERQGKARANTNQRRRMWVFFSFYKSYDDNLLNGLLGSVSRPTFFSSQKHSHLKFLCSAQGFQHIHSKQNPEELWKNYPSPTHTLKNPCVPIILNRRSFPTWFLKINSFHKFQICKCWICLKSWIFATWDLNYRSGIPASDAHGTPAPQQKKILEIPNCCF